MADRVLIETTRLAEETLNQELIHPLFPIVVPLHCHPLSVFWGWEGSEGQELGYASDLDLIFVYSLKTPYLQNPPDPPLALVRKGEKKVDYLP